MATSTLGSGTLVLAGTTSGTTTVTATAVAGTTTLTLPAATDTLVGKATTDTLTNKTLTGAVMNGTLGATTPSTVAATTLTTSSTVTHNGGTANGVAYLDGSKVLTTGSALVFDGTNLGVGTASVSNPNGFSKASNFIGGASGTGGYGIYLGNTLNLGIIGYFNSDMSVTNNAAGNITFNINSSEIMRIDSSGSLGIGVSSITSGSAGRRALQVSGGTDGGVLFLNNSGTESNNPRIFGKSTNFGDIGVAAGVTTGVISFYTNDIERMTVAAAGSVSVVGALSKGSGSFKIDHPLKPETHHLVHSFIEGPQADLIYRGKVNLVNGTATVNIDTVSTMTEGTFVILCRDVQCFTTNESDWTAVRGSVTGNILTIEAEDNTSTASISWMVIGERKDKHMMDTDWTDDNGKVIVEPLKEQSSTTVEGA